MLKSDKLDKLDDLPTGDAPHSPQEAAVMKKYFDADEEDDAPAKSTGKTWGATFKFAGIATVLFALLANPWIDMGLCYVPYCGGNAIGLLVLKMLIFMVLFVVLYRWGV